MNGNLTLSWFSGTHTYKQATTTHIKLTEQPHNTKNHKHATTQKRPIEFNCLCECECERVSV